MDNHKNIIFYFLSCLLKACLSFYKMSIDKIIYLKTSAVLLIRNYAKFLLLIPIKFYQLFISPFLGANCRFTPTCSQYAYDAVQEHGFFKGINLGIKRIGRCHPWHKGGFDPVPKKHPH